VSRVAHTVDLVGLKRPLQVEIPPSFRLPLDVPRWVFFRKTQESCPLRWLIRSL